MNGSFRPELDNARMLLTRLAETHFGSRRQRIRICSCPTPPGSKCKLAVPLCPGDRQLEFLPNRDRWKICPWQTKTDSIILLSGQCSREGRIYFGGASVHEVRDVTKVADVGVVRVCRSYDSSYNRNQNQDESVTRHRDQIQDQNRHDSGSQSGSGLDSGSVFVA